MVKVENLYSEKFNTVTAFNRAYKQIKSEFIECLGLGSKVRFPQGLIVLIMDNGGSEIKITSKDKETMTEYIKKFKGNDFKLFIKGNTYQVK